MKRVLIITYYWPPSGGGGVQRWLKFAKYLPEFGWQPVVYTPENADYPILDPALAADIPKEAEIIRYPILEPYRTFRTLSGRRKDKIHAGFIADKKGGSRLQKTLGWVRGNLFIPDARATWIRPSIRHLSKYLAQHPVDVLISTGPPHSMHLIARELHRKTGIPWVADFRDPWVNMDNLELFNIGSRAMQRHRMLEQAVLREASAVTGISWSMSREYGEIRGSEIELITNGYDSSDFGSDPGPDQIQFILGHYGTFGYDRDAPVFWEALSEWVKDPLIAQSLLLEFAGPTDGRILESARRAIGEERVKDAGYLDHNTVIQHLRQAACLLVVTNRNGNEQGRVTGKIFEYLAAARPVIGVGMPGSDLDHILVESKAGKVFSREDKDGIIAFLQTQWENWKSGGIPSTESGGVEQFSRLSLTGKLVKVMESLLAAPVQSSR